MIYNPGATLSQIVRPKTGNQSVTASTTLVDDEDLQFPVGAGETWVVDVFLKVEFNTAGQIKVAFNGPSAMNFVSLAASLTPEAIVPSTGATSTLDTAVPLVCVLATGGMVQMRCAFATSQAGTFAVRWAQNTSNAAATTVKEGSYLIANKV